MEELEEKEQIENQKLLRSLQPVASLKGPVRAPVQQGPATDLEMCKHLAKMIRQFLVGYTTDELEEYRGESLVESAERPNAKVHEAALGRLAQIAAELDPPVLASAASNQRLSFLAKSLSSGPKLKFR